jgi:hypothetical protein
VVLGHRSRIPFL